MKGSPPVPILLSDLGTPNVVFSLWYLSPGDRVFEGDRIAEVLIPGATVDIQAPTSGVFLERLVQPRDRVVTGQVLEMIEEEM